MDTCLIFLLIVLYNGLQDVIICLFLIQLVICNKSDPSANHIEVFHDVLDCTSWDLSSVISVKVIRGWWEENNSPFPLHPLTFLSPCFSIQSATWLQLFILLENALFVLPVYIFSESHWLLSLPNLHFILNVLKGMLWTVSSRSILKLVESLSLTLIIFSHFSTLTF